MRRYNKNLLFLIEQYQKGAAGVILEGSSRSGKTWSSIDFIIYLCSLFDDPITVTIVKETYNSFKSTLYRDFKRRLNDFGLDNPFERAKEISSFKIFNHTIQLMGADNPSKFHGLGSDFVYFNEMIDIPRAIFDQAEQRCSRFWWGDYNPSASVHYIYDNIIPRDDVAFLKTTFKDNPYISEPERRKILSYEPTEENKRQGTADDYMWSVYGLGERKSKSGVVFDNITWIDKFPEYERIGYALDLGFTTSPTVLTKATTIGNDLYAECLIYEPTEKPEDLSKMLYALGLENEVLWVDSAHPLFIGGLMNLGHRVFAIKKTKIIDGISMVKQYNLNIVRNRNVIKEAENYVWRTINDIPLDEPIKGFDHFWDSLRYNVLANFRKK